MNTRSNETTLVIGGTGKTGRRVAVGEIARVSGKAARYVPVTSEQYAAVLAPYLPAEQVTFSCDLFRYVLDGHNAHVSDDVQRVLGRRPRDFREFAVAAAEAWK